MASKGPNMSKEGAGGKMKHVTWMDFTETLNN